MKNNIQAYVNIYDITPTETFWDEVEDNVSPYEFWTQDDLINSIAEEGLRYPIRINRKGIILNGNMRYWCCRKLFEEGNERFRYLPVDLINFAGLAHIVTFNPLTKEVLDQYLREIINTKKDVIPSKTEFQEYAVHPTDPKKLANFEKTRETQWNIITTQHEDLNNITFIQV